MTTTRAKVTFKSDTGETIEKCVAIEDDELKWYDRNEQTLEEVAEWKALNKFTRIDEEQLETVNVQFF